MAHTQSAKKRFRQNKKRRLRNRAARSAVRTQIKYVHETVAEAPVAEAREELQLAIKKLDQAAAKGVIHPNQAARRKSRLTRLVNGMEKPAASQ